MIATLDPLAGWLNSQVVGVCQDIAVKLFF
jgi:hypothetical protein